MASATDAAPLLDLADPAVVADPYPHYARMRRAGEVLWHSRLGMWVTTGHAAAGAVLKNRRLARIFTGRPGADWEVFNWLHTDSILESEPPKHTRLRRLVSSAFTRGRIAALQPRIEELTAGLLADCREELADTGGFDVIARFAEPLPVLVIAELLGAPADDRVLLRDWSQAIVKMYEPEPTAEHRAAATAAAVDFAGYIDRLAADRAARPAADLLSALVAVRDEDGDRLSTTELIATAVLLLNAGHEASVNGFGNGLASLIASGEMPATATAVADDADAAALLVEELLRHDSPLHLFERTAVEDTQVCDVPILRGQKVAALLGAANRDPAVFDDPDRFDPLRAPNQHLAFGAGIHFCLGAPLARLELQIAVRALLREFGPLRLVRAHRRGTFVLRGYTELVVAPAG